MYVVFKDSIRPTRLKESRVIKLYIGPYLFGVTGKGYLGNFSKIYIRNFSC